MKRILLPTCLLFCAVLAWGQKMTREQYVEKYAGIAVREMKATGIPASITLAQGCLESGNGNSTLATRANNHFGIKCHNNWTGKTFHQDDDAKNECFRSYPSSEESFRDHSDFLRYRDRYAFLFDLEPTDYKGWAYGLKKAGYATAPDYATRLIRIIEDEELWRYDQLDEQAREALPPTPMQAEVSTTFKPLPGHKFYTASLSREIRTTNGVPWIRARAGDTYAGLAKEYSLFTRELLNFNDLRRKQSLQEGEIVYLEAKKRESAPNLEKHVVEEGETLRQLAQRYGVKMKMLCQYNNLRPGDPLEPGAILLLRNPR